MRVDVKKIKFINFNFKNISCNLSKNLIKQNFLKITYFEVFQTELQKIFGKKSYHKVLPTICKYKF